MAKREFVNVINAENNVKLLLFNSMFDKEEQDIFIFLFFLFFIETYDDWYWFPIKNIQILLIPHLQHFFLFFSFFLPFS